jgi:16S rRNA (uracil1498-N3)-methyltransferase
MHHFFVNPSQIGENCISIIGDDVNHIRNVLRMKNGEKLLISDGEGREYTCSIDKISDMEVIATIEDYQVEGRELAADIYLFQGLPKSDKMELIIQKAVELGVKAVVPVDTARSIVKLDKKKEDAKIKRWQAISESAAKQSKRGVIPTIHNVMSFKEAIAYVKDFDIKLIPYENCTDMRGTKDIISKIQKGMKVAIFIGPEGGFGDEEINHAMSLDVMPISLGKRILRTETAGLAILSVIMFNIEE